MVFTNTKERSKKKAWSGTLGSRSMDVLPDNCFWHKVVHGDTLSELAFQYFGRNNVHDGMEAIQQLNPFLYELGPHNPAHGVERGTALFTGDFLVIPNFKHPACKNFFPVLEAKDPPADPARTKIPVQQEWVLFLPFQQQSALLMGIRWADTLPDFHPAKDVVRAYRACILKGAWLGRALTENDDGDKYMSAKIIDSLDWQKITVTDFFTHISGLPEHFLTHLFEGANLLGVHHPNAKWRQRWKLFYEEACEKRRMMPEPAEITMVRLGDNGRRDWGK